MPVWVRIHAHSLACPRLRAVARSCPHLLCLCSLLSSSTSPVPSPALVKMLASLCALSRPRWHYPLNTAQDGFSASPRSALPAAVVVLTLPSSIIRTALTTNTIAPVAWITAQSIVRLPTCIGPPAGSHVPPGIASSTHRHTTRTGSPHVVCTAPNMATGNRCFKSVRLLIRSMLIWRQMSILSLFHRNFTL
ncbi:hypothetical protein GGX14DRAFT_557388 [Mycena pura]|uniref:Uncharacterized protein n=1 Tax=Mycena pura TaxID=153505 RepID=A0AAD7E2E9_9AGAR|nr:hypothetical protein GGX14DRAFT_557388 [Mycena pura]